MTMTNTQLPTRRLPNILITGTPGTGKTTMSELLSAATSLQHINVGDLVKEKSLHEGWDDEFQCYIVDEDKVCDELEDIMNRGGNVVDFHTVDFFPERWFDLVVVLRTENGVLFPRLEARQYSSKKIEENVTAEIMQVILEDARNSYREDIIVELSSNTVEDMEANVEQVREWAEEWVKARMQLGQGSDAPVADADSDDE
ncbi:AAA domain-domain-containing protein [Catenaria anguillulae PL171]|uniref:Adenylate kinase isoenzyme 6 homolog n=1 Tax=Catenaria anguillulae PL171 TaxID=765915 RepID=A0A1Y2HQI6_9FUNG|nr:AAA domain-domain-containing protein [Catenaria anguillulae PL171]